MRNGLIFILLAIAGLSACKDEPAKPGLPGHNGNRVIILNEGNFQWGNASISLYDPDSMTVIQEVFRKSNGRPLGDVAQSITLDGAYYYVVVNNSGIVMVLDTADFKLEKTWEGFVSPRYLFHVDDATAIVSDLYANGVFVVDKPSGTIRKKIAINGWTDRMMRHYNDLFVTNRDGSAVYRIDLKTYTITDSIVVSDQPNQMLLDNDFKMWILCSGKLGEGKGALWVVDPVSGQTIRKFNLNVAAFVYHLASDPSREEIYYIEGDLFRMHFRDTVLPMESFIPLDVKIPYMLKVNQQNGDIYISDAQDYLSKSKVYRYNSAGNPLDLFETGIIAGDMVFE